MANNIVAIKKGDILYEGEYLLERNRFDKSDFVIYKITAICYDEGWMVLLDVQTGRSVSAHIDCHHSQGSRFTWLTYKFTEIPAVALLYDKT